MKKKRIQKVVAIAFKEKIKILLVSLIIFFLIKMLTPLIQPFVLMWINDSLEKGDVRQVIYSLVISIVATIINGGLLYFLLVYLDTWADSIIQNNNMKFIEYLMDKAYYSLLRKYKNGDLVNRVNEASKGVFSFILVPCNMLAKIITCICFAIPLSQFGWRAWCIVLIVFLFIIGITKFQFKIERQLHEKMQKSYGDKEIITREIFTNIEFYKMVGLQNDMYSFYCEQRDEMFGIGLKQALYSAIFDTVHSFIILCGKIILLLLVFPSRFVNIVTAGLLSSILMIYDNLIAQLEGMRALVVELPKQMVPIDRYGEILEIKNNNNGMNLDIYLSLEHITLKLENNCILKDINIIIKKGEKVAIIGENGSGKSTLLRVMLGLYDEEVEGKRKCSIECKWDQVSYVPVKHQLFNGTIYENICSAKKYKRECKIEDNKLYSEIADIKDKWKDELSEGQKQTTNILRGIYKIGNIIFGDEILHSIDSRKCDLVMESICNHTDSLVCITHTDKYLSLFDRVIIMEGGRIVADASVDIVKKTDVYQRWLYN